MTLRNKSSFICGILLLSLHVSGCYLPPTGKQTLEEDVVRIEVGTSTKEEVHELIGKPNTLDTENFALYYGTQSKGGVLALLPGGGIAGAELGRKDHCILLEYDSDGLVKKFQLATEKNPTWAVSKNTFTGLQTTAPEPSLVRTLAEKIGKKARTFGSVDYFPQRWEPRNRNHGC